MKLALGTAQFGMEYGIANRSGRIGPEEVGEILTRARTSGIDTLDTAIAYGQSENVLGAQGVRDWNVVTKLPDVPSDCEDVARWVTQNILGSLARLGVNQLHGVLLHRPMQLLESFGSELFLALRAAQSRDLVRKVGVSVYDVVELDTILSLFDCDLIQAPLNILDRTLDSSGWIDKLKRASIETHVRSPFLQGLLLMPPQSRPEKFLPWGYIWRTWDEWLDYHGVTPLQACLRYLGGLDGIDKIVVGVDSLDQINQIILAAMGEMPELPVFKPLHDQRLLNPALWGEL